MPILPTSCSRLPARITRRLLSESPKAFPSTRASSVTCSLWCLVYRSLLSTAETIDSRIPKLVFSSSSPLSRFPEPVMALPPRRLET